MKGFKRTTMAVALAAAAIAAPTHAQTKYSTAGVGGSINFLTRGHIPQEERPFAVMRLLDSDATPAMPTAVDAAGLARARATGELPATAVSPNAVVIERAAPAPAARTPAVVQVGNVGAVVSITNAGAVVAVPNPSAAALAPNASVKAGARASAQPAMVPIDDVARSREHAKYEADKKRRVAAETIQASAQARARIEEQTRAAAETTAYFRGPSSAETISWSYPEARSRSIEVQTTVPVSRVDTERWTPVEVSELR